MTEEELLKLPLCSIFADISNLSIPESTITIDERNNNTYDCVKECHEFGNSDNSENIRGSDYAVHGVNCIRFYPHPDGNKTNTFNYNSSPLTEKGSNLSDNINSISMKPFCHQVGSSIDPDPDDKKNCKSKKCYELHDEELNKIKDISDDAIIACNNNMPCIINLKDKPYCDIDDKKCYEFRADDSETSNSLKYIPYNVNNKRCLMHDCDIDLIDYDNYPDIIDGSDGSNVMNNCNRSEVDSINGNTNLVEKYKKYIDPNFDTKSSFCNYDPANIECNIKMINYLCSENSDRDSKCDTECDQNNMCYKVVDCNNEESKNSVDDFTIQFYCNNVIDNEIEINEETVDLQSWFYRPKRADDVRTYISYMQDNANLCYKNSNIIERGWGGEDVFGLLWYTLFEEELSPGHCSALKFGSRSIGYLGLTNDLYSPPDEDSLYNDGVVVHGDTNNLAGSHKYNIRTCARFSNAGRLNTFGARECGLNCFFGSCTQWCGFDKCLDLTVERDSLGNWSESTKKCGKLSMKDRDYYDNYNKSESCIKQFGDTGIVDGYVRLRASGYGDRMVCVFLDYTGAFVTKDIFMKRNGSSQPHRQYIIKDLPNTKPSCTNNDDSNECRAQYCSDPYASISDNCQGGWDASKYKGLASVWRTAMRGIHVSEGGYTDPRNNISYPAQECAYIPLVNGPPRFYRIATPDNSPHLFRPAIIMTGKEGCVNYRGEDVVCAIGSFVGQNKSDLLDFHYPKVIVNFGDDSKELFLTADLENSEEVGTIKSNEVIFETGSETGFFSVKLYIIKESNSQLCLYEKRNDIDGSVINKQRSCIKRKEPEAY
ncbi:hypothetical protein N9O56_02995 [Rickettsiales bacterium]|nr:hypothetical protein [Rickettsiales bacterium]